VRLRHAHRRSSDGRGTRQALLPVCAHRPAPSARSVGWAEPLPIRCWAIEHGDKLLLVDTGESASARDVPFARFEVSPAQELPEATNAAGLSLDHVDTVPESAARLPRR
jgi:hypothetical protein